PRRTTGRPAEHALTAGGPPPREWLASRAWYARIGESSRKRVGALCGELMRILASIPGGEPVGPPHLAEARRIGTALGREVAGLEVVVIQTAGDRAQDVPLEHLEGIGFFARELETALLEGRCDLAVHSAKDLPTEIHRDLVLGAFTPRADPRDVLVAGPGRWLATLPPGASVATSSVRRSAQILHFRPDLRTVPIRGNIDTRLGKLDSGVYDALCL